MLQEKIFSFLWGLRLYTMEMVSFWSSLGKIAEGMNANKRRSPSSKIFFIEPPSPTPGLHRHYNHPSISIIFPKNAQI